MVVIGGGDTAMDCVRTAVRQGATSVTCLYRRDRANMPGSAREVANAEEEGVVFDWLASPRAVRDAAGRVCSVRAIRTALSDPGPDGRRSIRELADSAYDCETDMVIEALGFEPEDLRSQFDTSDLAVHDDGTVWSAAGTRATTLEGVFVAGDISRGASLVVWAVREGQDAAAEIHGWLSARQQVAA